MKIINRFLTCVLANLFFIGICIGQEITILHTNDMHSKLIGYGPESEYSPHVINNDNTLGGFARLASLLDQEKAKNPNATLIVDAGDFLMGSLFHSTEAETGFQLNLMKKIGYNYITLGNHEFEFGPGNLAKCLKSAEEKGGFPQIVASNIVFSKKSKEDDELETFYSKKSIVPYSIVEKNGIKIGIIGLLGFDAVSVVPAAKPVSFSNHIEEAAKLVKYLKNIEKVNLIITLSHSGILPNKEKNGFYGEDIDLAKKVPLIDIIISGHTHVKTPEFIKIGNTYIVQAGSYANDLGEINLKCEKGKITNFKSHLIPIDDKIMGNKEISKEIETQIELIDQKYLAGTGLTYKTPVAKTNFDLKCDYANLKESNLGPFLTDATKYYLDKTWNNTDISIIASGTIREDLLKGQYGIFAVSDVFRVMSLGKGNDKIPGYPLAKIYITGHELKKLMEILVISRSKGGDGFIYFSGIKTYINSQKGFLKKVQKIEVKGKEIDMSKHNPQLYSISANTYLLSFIGRIKKMSHGLVRLVPKDKNGKPVKNMKSQIIDIDPAKEGVQEAKEWIAVVEFMKSFDKNSDGISVIPDIYRKSDESIVELAKK